MNNKNILYSFIAALLLALVAFLFFAPADYDGMVLQQPDMTQGIANGQEAKMYEETTGEKAYWTNSLFSGMPTFQISPSYSSNKMMEWIVKVYTLWLPSPANLLFAMMLGFFIMGLCFRMKWPVALFGAVAWGFSTYFIIIIGAGHIWKFLTLSYIPPMIGGIALCYRGKYLYGAAITALFAALQLASNHLQMTYYFLFVIGALVIAWLYTAIREKKIKQWGIATLCIIGAGGLGVCANMASLYLSYEYSKETQRGRATEIVMEGEAPGEGLDIDYITQWSYGVDETMSLLIPNIKGGASAKPVKGQMKPWRMNETDKIKNSYLSMQDLNVTSQFPQYFGEQPSTNGPVYVGAFVLLLAILAMFVVDGKVLGPMKWALFAVSILAILLAWGHNFRAFTEFFVNNVPFYNKFRTPSSMLVVVEFCVPLLAAMAVIKMIRTPDFLKRYGVVFYTVSGVVAFVCFIGWIAPGTFGDPWNSNELDFIREVNGFTDPQLKGSLLLIEESRLSMVSSDSLRSLLFIILGCLVCYLYLRGAFKNTTMFGCALTAVVLIDLFSVNKRYLDNDSFVYPAESANELAPTQFDLAILQDTTMNYRVLDIMNMRSAKPSYFHKAVGGYHAAKLTRYNDLLNYQLDFSSPNGVNEQVLNMLNTKYIIYPDTLIENPDAFGNGWMVDKISYVESPNAEMEALDLIPLRAEAVAESKFKDVLGEAAPVEEGDYVRETTYAPGVLDYTVNSKNGGIAVFSEIYFPWGWKATVDGQPVDIARVDYVLRAIRVPAGKHHVHFEFHPERLESTNTLSIISMSLIYLLCLGALGICGWQIYRNRNRKNEPEGKI